MSDCGISIEITRTDKQPISKEDIEQLENAVQAFDQNNNLLDEIDNPFEYRFTQPFPKVLTIQLSGYYEDGFDDWEEWEEFIDEAIKNDKQKAQLVIDAINNKFDGVYKSFIEVSG